MFDWKTAYAPNCKCSNTDIRTIKDIEKSNFEKIKANVPGNFELDLMKHGKIDDLYFSDNVFSAQKLENLHIWYYSEFYLQTDNSYLLFNGIDTMADIYINGELAMECDNMFIPYEVDKNIKKGRNEVVVHIKPVCIEMRNYPLSAANYAQKYSYESLYARKAAHSFGWDIMPRIVTSGLWKSVELKEKKKDKINEVYFVTKKLNLTQNKAELLFFVNSDVSGDFITEYSIRISGECEDSCFVKEMKLWHNSFQFDFEVENVKPWWPRNQGKQNLYTTTVELLYKGSIVDTYKLNMGIRTVELDRTDYIDKDGNGEFCFKINNRKTFILGTNWVPLDAFHSNDSSRLDKALELLFDSGCNMVRCWGGNVYESDEFFDFCDNHGIMVWQDFMMGCAFYPQDKKFCDMVKKEAEYQVKRLRNHSSLVLWAGDNECDIAYMSWNGVRRDPTINVITRTVLKNVITLHDYARPYISSSPYISKRTYDEELMPAEDHLWGPRDYFKSDFYKNSTCCFASETGYHGMPSYESLKKFLKEPEKLFKEDFKPTDEYNAHASSMELSDDAVYSYRMKLLYDQVVTLFGKAEENFCDFVKQSQISQAEALKYFIERFRIKKWRTTGIIWWNLLDGWPQISDAVVDYYYNKKLAYNYIKRSQEPVCLMLDEPVDGVIKLFGVNDFCEEKEIQYEIINYGNDEIALKGSIKLPQNSSTCIGEIEINADKQEFYYIKWVYDKKEHNNHYLTNIININYNDYINSIKKCGFYEFN